MFLTCGQVIGNSLATQSTTYRNKIHEPARSLKKENQNFRTINSSNGSIKWCRDPTSGPHPCVPSTLPAKLSPQPFKPPFSSTIQRIIRPSHLMNKYKGCFWLYIFIFELFVKFGWCCVYTEVIWAYCHLTCV